MKIGTLALAFISIGFGTSRAATLAAADPYNVFIFGNMTENNVDSEGRIAVGGNANLTNFGVGSSFSSNPSSAGNSLVVGGNLTYNGGEVHYGSVVYGGTLTGAVSAPNGTVTQGSFIDFSSAQSFLTSHSTYWSTLPANGSTINEYGGVKLVGTNSSLNIFLLSGSVLSSSWGLTIDAPVGATVLINIDGNVNDFDNLGISFQDINNDGTGITSRNKVLYNFYQSTSLSISGISVQGSILAPHAAVTFGNGNIEGNLVAASLTGSGEAHNYLFSGSLPSIPEPGSLSIFASLGMLGCFVRSRKH